MLVLLMTLPANAEPAATTQPDLSGRWVLDLSVVISAKIPVFGQTELVTQTTMLATIADGIQHHTTCTVNPTSPLRMVTTIVPDGFIRHIKDKSYPITVSEDGAYRADFGAQHIAYDPALSGGEPPKDADDPAVFDWENDGKPGATILLDAPLFGRSEVYITQLAHTRLIGQITGPDTIAGGLNVVAMRQRSIGAKPAMFASNPEATPVEEKSSFVMRRVPPDTTCADL